MKITRWVPHEAGQMLGFFTTETQSGLVIPDFRALRNKAGEIWIGLPNKPMLSPDGQVLVDDAGKRSYQPTITFRDKSTEKKFLELVVQALRRDHPELFAGGGAP
jgi:hypothetical protein